MDFRIAQVSDPHLSRNRAYFQDNWDVFVAMMAEDPPDIVVCSGDLCFDGVHCPDDLAYARTQLDRLAVPWLAIPGNHDIGDQPPDLKFRHPVDAEKRARWLAELGADYWFRDCGAWRLVGLDAMLFDSGLEAEAEQWDWFERILAARGNRRVLLFVHKPLYLVDPHESAQSTLHLGARSRQRLFDLAQAHDIAVIASGHLHRYADMTHRGIQLVWAPALGFVLEGYPAGLDVGHCRPGYVEYRISGDRIAHRFALSPRLALNDMRQVMEQHKSTVYLPPRPL